MVTAIKAMRAGEIENKGMPAEMGWSGQASEEVTFGNCKNGRGYRPEQKLTKSIADSAKSKCKGPPAGKNFPCTKHTWLVYFMM